MRTGSVAASLNVRSRRRWLDEHIGAVLGIGLPVAAAAAAKVSPAAGVVELLVPVAATALAVLLLHRREQPAYLEFIVWLWILTPWVRRVVDDSSSFSEQSLILLAAPLASLPALFPGIASGRRLPRYASRAFAFGLVAFAYSFIGGLIRFGPVPATIGLTTWLAPLAVGLWLATAPIEEGRLRQTFGRLAVQGALVLGAYGVYQFFFLPEWDAAWMTNIELISIGRPFPFEVRVFSTLNSPAVMATVLGALLVLLTAAKSRLRWPAALFGFTCFGLSLVRAAWIGLLVALVALVASGQSRAVRNAVLIITVPVALLIGVEGPAQDAVTERFNSSVQEADQDTSFEDRVLFHQQVLPVVMGDVFGRGFGSTGSAAAQLSGDNEEAAIVSVDSGVLDSLLSMGAIVGTAFLFVVFAAAAATWRKGRRGGPIDQAAGAATVAIAAQMVLGNVLTSASGIMFWLLVGLVARVSDDPRRPPGALSVHDRGYARPLTTR